MRPITLGKFPTMIEPNKVALGNHLYALPQNEGQGVEEGPNFSTFCCSFAVRPTPALSLCAVCLGGATGRPGGHGPTPSLMMEEVKP